MTKSNPESAERWADGGSANDPRLHELFRALRPPEPLSRAELARVRARLNAREQRSSSRRTLRELVLVVVMLCSGASVALAGMGVVSWWPNRSTRSLFGASPAASSSLLSPRTPHRAKALPRPVVSSPPAPSAPSAPEALPPSPVPSSSITASTASAPASSAPAPAPAPAASVELAVRAAPTAELNATALARESAALERVLVKLRREHDPAAALAALDEAQALFSRGTLELEARVARIDALLALRRQSEALALLEHLPFEQTGRGSELRLVRAELRAASDCSRAISDFDLLTERALTGELAERALYGRALCELRLGDEQGARRSLAHYLQQFPSGRFAPEVQRLLNAH